MNELDTSETSDWTSLVDVELSGLSAPQQARWTVREQLAGVVTVPYMRDVMLATSELVTNAIRYAVGPCRLSMTRHLGSSRLRIGVSDTNPDMPQTINVGDDPLTTGRGLLIVDTIASSWGAQPSSTGKEVWFEMVPDQRG